MGGFYGSVQVRRADREAIKGAVEAKVDYDGLERKLRKQQEQMLNLINPKQLPPEIGSIGKFKEQLEQQMTLQIRRMREESAKIGTPECEADRESGSAIVFRMIFDQSGEWLCLGTSKGAWVYPWSEVVQSGEDLPRPSLAVDAGSRIVETDRGSMMEVDYVYGVDYDPERHWLLFGGLEGPVRYLDLRTGRSGVLFEPPVQCPMTHLGPSIDRSALGLTSQPEWHSNSIHKAGPVVQFWDYPALCRRT
jgi:hypothetical protein